MASNEGSNLDQVPLEVKARGQEAYDAFIEALKGGSKPIYQTCLMLIGPERVGKTSLIKALTGQEFNKNEGITDGIDASLSCTLSVKHIINWKLQTDTPEGKLSKAKQKYLRAVAEKMQQQMKHGIQSKSEKLSSGELPKLPVATEQSLDLTTTSQGASTLYDEVNTLMRNFPQEDAALAVITDVSEEDIQRVSEIIQENEKLGQNEGIEETVDDLTLSIWDFAGQDVYYITHQVFPVPRGIYILCFNLCHDLNAPAKFEIYKRGGEKVSSFEHHMTYLEFIIFWLRSIYSNTTENQTAPDQEQSSPPVFIAGTHKDMLPGNEEERNALAEKQFAEIRKALRGKPYQSHVVEQYYAINNSLRSPLDPSIVKLRDHITEVAQKETYLKQPFPIKWLRFWHEIEQLRNNQMHSINFTEVKDLAAECGIIKNEDLFASLHLYHDLGNIVYYGKLATPDSALNHIIILNPQWLIFIFCKVFTVKGKVPKFIDSWERLNEHGILEERLIRHMWHEYLDKLDYLLELVQMFDLLCLKTQFDEVPADVVRSPEEGKRLFYIPSLLKKPDDETMCTNQPIASKSMVILHIDFDGFLPEGLFYRLVVRLVRLVQQSQNKEGYEPRLFYQQANLYVDEKHEMILRILPEKRSRIEVTIMRAIVESDSDEEEDGEKDDAKLDPATCKMVLKCLNENLKYLGRTWMKRGFLYGFYIPCKVCKKITHIHELKRCLTEGGVPCGNIRMKTGRIKHLFKEWEAKQEPLPLGNGGQESQKVK